MNDMAYHGSLFSYLLTFFPMRVYMCKEEAQP